MIQMDAVCGIAKNSTMLRLPPVTEVSWQQKLTKSIWVTAATMNQSPVTDDLVFRVHLILMSKSQRNPKVRMLLVSVTSSQVVYEGIGSWSVYASWLGKFLWEETRTRHLYMIKRILIRHQYATLQELKVSLQEVESCGLLPCG